MPPVSFICSLLVIAVCTLPALARAQNTHAQNAHAQNAKNIVVQADKVRHPGEPFRSLSTLVDYSGGQERSRQVVSVHAKPNPATGQYRNLIRYIDPPRDAGKLVLLDGQSLWFYDPASKSSVRISPQQRLLGQASIADILATNYAVDYTATLLGEETIEDPARTKRLCWHLDLKASNDQASYLRIEYWVEKGSYLPIKGKFYADSGRLMKILYYRGFAERLGLMRPSEAVIINAVDTQQVTTVGLGEVTLQDVPDRWFQRDYLPLMKGD
jgi:outer membrane lipoprotein-sorting protein